MSIILKGIELPKDIGDIISINLYDKKDNWLDNIEVDCKDIIEIPTPHGRLGDLDVLLEESLKEGAYNYVDSWQIAEQPTILEAEEEK